MLVVEILAAWFGISVVVGLVFGQVLRRTNLFRRGAAPARPGSGQAATIGDRSTTIVLVNVEELASSGPEPGIRHPAERNG